MIGTFWNICRACPSAPVDKLHSEYRSTYRWHEYAGPRTEVIRNPPQGFVAGCSQEPAFPRRKKHPEVAHRTHQFLSDGGSEALLGSSMLHDRARSEERWATSREKNSRRSKSEGRPAEKSTYSLISVSSGGKPFKNIPTRSRTTLKINESFGSDEIKVPVSTVKPFGIRYNIRQNELSKEETVNTRQPLTNRKVDEPDSSPKKTVVMSLTKSKEPEIRFETVPVHKNTEEPKKKADQDLIQLTRAQADCNMSTSGSQHQDETHWEPKSEYKKNFQPFNRYEYDEQKGVFEKKTTPVNSCTAGSEADSKSLSSWYREVILLRQKANQYRHRGWGTELIPEHIAQLYNDQIMVWEQVSRRSTLSALSLATSLNCRDSSPSKEDKENRKSSPVKSLSRARSAKANAQPTATHHIKFDSKKSATGVKSQTDSSPKKDVDKCDFPLLGHEQVVKSPPEPTRVKSPEQIVIRSPEPVNWTVPLDTGKTFTVTQNIREGDSASRSYSEVRVCTPNVASQPPASMSAPTELREFVKANVQGEILSK